MRQTKKSAKKFIVAASVSTAVYELLISSPWWTGAKSGSYDMLLNLTAPSIILLIFVYYLVQKKLLQYSVLLSIYIIALQLAILLTIYGTIRGILH